MASGFSKSVQAAITNWLRGTAMPAAPTSLKVALSYTEIAADGSGLSEPATAAGYSRQAVTLAAPEYVSGVGTKVSNDSALVFGPATTAWNTVRAVAILDNNGNVLLSGNLVAPRAAPVGDTLSFGINTLEFSVA